MKTLKLEQLKTKQIVLLDCYGVTYRVAVSYIVKGGIHAIAYRRVNIFKHGQARGERREGGFFANPSRIRPSKSKTV